MPGAAPPILTRAATVVLLVAGGVVALLWAVSLVAAAIGRSFAPLDLLPLPSDHVARAWWLAVLLVALIALLWLVLRYGEERLTIRSPRGVIHVPRIQLECLAEAAARTDDEVVRAVAHLRVRGERLRGSVSVAARPLADAAEVVDAVGARVHADLSGATGLQDVTVKVRPRVLRVRQLRRYLP